MVWHVRLTDQAELDLLDIMIWTAENFGRRQAIDYAETITLAIEALHDGPEVLGAKERKDIGTRSIYPILVDATAFGHRIGFTSFSESRRCQQPEGQGRLGGNLI